jgi:hypothetical protein
MSSSIGEVPLAIFTESSEDTDTKVLVENSKTIKTLVSSDFEVEQADFGDADSDTPIVYGKGEALDYDDLVSMSESIVGQNEYLMSMGCTLPLFNYGLVIIEGEMTKFAYAQYKSFDSFVGKYNFLPMTGSQPERHVLVTPGQIVYCKGRIPETIDTIKQIRELLSKQKGKENSVIMPYLTKVLFKAARLSFKEITPEGYKKISHGVSAKYGRVGLPEYVESIYSYLDDLIERLKIIPPSIQYGTKGTEFSMFQKTSFNMRFHGAPSEQAELMIKSLLKDCRLVNGFTAKSYLGNEIARRLVLLSPRNMLFKKNYIGPYFCLVLPGSTHKKIIDGLKGSWTIGENIMTKDIEVNNNYCWVLTMKNMQPDAEHYQKVLKTIDAFKGTQGVKVSSTNFSAFNYSIVLPKLAHMHGLASKKKTIVEAELRQVEIATVIGNGH